LFDLCDHLKQAPDVVIGHSLGGKVALAYAKRHEEASLAHRAPQLSMHGVLRQIWTLDSDPGAQVPGGAHQVRQVVAALLAHPGPLEARADAVSAIESEGMSSGLATGSRRVLINVRLALNGVSRCHRSRACSTTTSRLISGPISNHEILESPNPPPPFAMN